MSQTNEALNLLRFAAEMEKTGERFFLEHAERFQDPRTVRLFHNLAAMERHHHAFIMKQMERYQASPDDYSVSDDIKTHSEDTLFGAHSKAAKLDVTLTESQTPDINVIRMAYLIEHDFKTFYEEAVDTVDDPELKDLFRRLAAWEAGHESFFKHEYDRLKRECLALPWGG